MPLKSKQEDFIGREALPERKAHPQRQLVGLALAGDELVGHGDSVYSGRARVDVKYAQISGALEVGKLDGFQKRLPATVVRFAFYDPEKLRMKA